MNFLSATDVGRLVPAPAEEDLLGEAQEWELQRREREVEGGGVEAEELGAGGEEQPLFLPTPSFMAFAEEQ